MSIPPGPDPFQVALQHQQAGRLNEAAAIYQTLLRTNPNLPAVLHQFGLLFHQAGRPAEGLPHLRHALALEPGNPSLLTNAASLYLAAGQPGPAEAAARQALALQPDLPQAAGNLGLALALLGRGDEAEAAYRRALALLPDFPDAQFNLANLLRDRGDLAAAIALYRTLLAARPQFAAAAVNLGVALDLAGDLEAAAAAYRAAIAQQPGLALAHLNLGLVLQKQNRFAEAVASFRAALAHDARLPAAQMGLGQCARELGDTAAAMAAFRAAVDLAPGDAAARAALSGLLSGLIPGWHFPMLADAARNDAYATAIAKAVRPGMQVLDIGTGSGLLALLAARAGASHVTAVEAHPVIAATARQIVAKNGYEATITVIAKRSTELDASMLPEPADLIVSEILDAGLIGEGMLPTSRDALKRLARPGAATIPARARVMAQLMALPVLRQVNPLRTVCGFDLSPFDAFRNAAAHGNVRLDHEEHVPLGAVQPVLDIDFRTPPDWTRPQGMDWTAMAARDGIAQAVVFWFELWLDDEIMLSTGPGGALRHWGQAACWLPEDRPVTAGAVLPFRVTLADNYIDFIPA